MKKIISLFLALLMAFSVVTVAFAAEADADETTTVAADEETTAPAEDEEGTDLPVDFGEFNWILDLPFWTVKPAFKFAKIAFKLVSVYLTVAKIFGMVDKDMGDMILEAILGLIENTENGEAAEEETTVAPTTEAVAA